MSAPVPPSEPLAPRRSANYITLRLDSSGPLWQYQPSGLSVLACRFVKLLGHLAVAVSLLAWLFAPQQVLPALFGIGVGGLFVYLGGLIEQTLDLGAQFDPVRRQIRVLATPMYWQSSAALRRPQTRHIGFDQVAALQLLGKQAHLGSRGGSFSACELNLLLHSGERLNVIDHNGLQQIRQEARRLGQLLQVPVVEQLLPGQ